jgi:hypothetical protein
LCLCINETATDNHKTTYQAIKEMDKTLALSAWVHRSWHHWLTWWLNKDIKHIPLVEDKPKISKSNLPIKEVSINSVLTILTPLNSLPICGNLTPGLGPPGGYLGPMNDCNLKNKLMKYQLIDFTPSQTIPLLLYNVKSRRCPDQNRTQPPHQTYNNNVYNIARHSKKKEDERLETTTTDLSNILLGLSTFVVEEVGNVGTVGKMDA